MAITLKDSPDSFSPVSNEMIFVVAEPTKTADPITYPNYKFVADVYVGGVLKARLKAFPDPIYSFGVFDVSKILQPEFTYDFDIDDIIDYPVLVDYQVKFGEEYSDTLYTNVLTDSTRSCSNTYKADPYGNLTVLATGLASNMPTTRTAFHDPTLYPGGSFNYFLVPYWVNASGVCAITATYKDKNGATITSNSLSSSKDTGDLRQFNISNSSIQTNQIIISGVTNLTINLECTKHPVRTLVWLNPYGGYDSQHFAMVSKYKKEVERKSFTQTKYAIDSNGLSVYINEGTVGSILRGGKKTFAVNSIQKWELSSHIMTDAEYQWMGDLLSSPSVYMYDSSVGWIPVTITNSNYERRTYLNSRMNRRLELEVEYSNPYNSQFL